MPEKSEEINKFLETIKTFGKVIDNDGIKSKIINNDDSYKIQNWLKESIGEVKNYELIYRASEDGDSNSVSFQKCKNIQNLIWIMKDKNNNIFGCFNSIAINKTNSYSKDSKCFLYIINRNKKYIPNLNVENNIYHCSQHLIEFGNNAIFEFVVGDKFLSSSSVSFTNNNIFNLNLELSVSLEELEVFKVIQ